jgi:hypothetical protein
MESILNGKYKIHKGRFDETMPELLKQNQIPLSIAQLIDLICEESDSNKLNIHNCYTRDAFVEYNGKIKFIPNSHKLMQITPETTKKGEYFLLTREEFNKMQVEHFNKEELNINQYLTKKQAKKNPILKILARTQNRLDNFVDYAFEECKKIGHKNATGIFLENSFIPNLKGGLIRPLQISLLKGFQFKKLNRYSIGTCPLQESQKKLIGIPIGECSMEDLGVEENNIMGAKSKLKDILSKKNL